MELRPGVKVHSQLRVRASPDLYRLQGHQNRPNMLPSLSGIQACAVGKCLLGTRYLVPGTCRVPSAEYQIPGAGYRVRRSRVQSTRYQVPGTECGVPGTGYRVQSTRYRVPGTWYREPLAAVSELLLLTEYRVRRFDECGIELYS